MREEGLPRSARQLFSGKRVAELMVRKLGVGESEWRKNIIPRVSGRKLVVLVTLAGGL